MQRFSRAQIWQVNRHSIAGGIAIGLFFGSLPIPVQMLCAAIAAIFCRVNLPTAIFATFFSNPLTMAPIFYGNYRLGAWLIGGVGTAAHAHFHFDTLYSFFDTLYSLGGRVLVALYTGSVVMGLLFAIIGFSTVKLLWRLQLVHVHRKRRRRR